MSIKATRTEHGYRVRIENLYFYVKRNPNESAGSSVAWIVSDGDNWIYEAASKRDCLDWLERRYM